MYAYNRFWDAEKVMLLYPGAKKNTSYKSFETNEYHPNTKMDPFQHQCKMGFVDVVDESGALVSIAEDIFNQLEFQ
jgi:5-methylcytosine-specific restriction enzyme subunit McrC